MTISHWEFQPTWRVKSILWWIVLWILLTIITFGLASIPFYYAAAQKLIHKTLVYDNNKQLVGELNVSLENLYGHITGWVFLYIFTAGLASLFFPFVALRRILDNTKIVEPSQEISHVMVFSGKSTDTYRTGDACVHSGIYMSGCSHQRLISVMRADRFPRCDVENHETEWSLVQSN